MDKELLGSSKFFLSENKDINFTIELKQNSDCLPGSEFAYNLDIAERSEKERLASEKFRVYGQLEYKSIIDGITKQSLNGTTNTPHFDIDEILSIDIDSNPRTFLNSFDVYLCAKDSILSPTPVVNNDIITDGYYIQNFKIISEYVDFLIDTAGYYVTEDNEKIWYLNFNKLFDISGLKDYFNKPLTDFYLYFRYKPFNSEIIYERSYVTPYINKNYNYISLTGGNTSLSSGTILNGDIINFKKENYLEETLLEQNYRISVPCSIQRFSTFRFYTDLNDLLTKIVGVNIIIQDISFDATNLSPNGNRATIKTNSLIFGALYTSLNTFYEIPSSYFTSFFRKIYIEHKGNNVYTLLFKNIGDVDYNFNLKLLYNPFVKIPLKKWSNYSENGTQKTDIIPEHAIKLDADNYIWKDYELNKIFPFVNDCHYVYQSIFFSVIPDLTDPTTYNIFKNFDLNSRFLLKNYNANNISFPTSC